MIGNHRPKQGQSAESALKKLIDEQCAFTANEMKVYVGSQLVVDIVNDPRYPELQKSECIQKLDKLLKLDKYEGQDSQSAREMYVLPDGNVGYNIEKQFLIDLTEKSPKNGGVNEQFQICLKPCMDRAEKAAVREHLESLRGDDVSQMAAYRNFVKHYPGFKHLK